MGSAAAVTKQDWTARLVPYRVCSHLDVRLHVRGLQPRLEAEVLGPTTTRRLMIGGLPFGLWQVTASSGRGRRTATRAKSRSSSFSISCSWPALNSNTAIAAWVSATIGQRAEQMPVHARCG